jgi:rubrerythrin
MEKFGSMEEILTFAVNKEEASYLFYTDMARMTEDKDVSQLFEDFAAEELRHRERLLLEIMKMGKIVSTDDDWSNRTRAEYAIDVGLPEDFSYTDALKLAIAKENAAFKLYVDLLKLTEDPEAIEMFTALAEDEVRHKIGFQSAYEKHIRQQH